jgi:hypothetical protein
MRLLTICIVPSGKRLLLGIAAGNGVSSLDAKTLEVVGYFEVREGVRDVRSAGPDAIVYSRGSLRITQSFHQWRASPHK